MGFPRNLGGPAVSTLERPDGETGIKAPSLWQVALDGHRSEQRVQGGTASRGQPKERGMDGRESERLVLPKKRGNRVVLQND